MRVLVVADDQGRILSISKPGDVEDSESGIGAAGVLPDLGQRVHSLELSEELASRPLLELHQEFRLELRGAEARLVSGRDFVEPFRRVSASTEDETGHGKSD